MGGCSCLFSDLRKETCFYLNVLKKINCRRKQRSMNKKKAEHAWMYVKIHTKHHFQAVSNKLRPKLRRAAICNFWAREAQGQVWRSFSGKIQEKTKALILLLNWYYNLQFLGSFFVVFFKKWALFKNRNFFRFLNGGPPCLFHFLDVVRQVFQFIAWWKS